MFSCSVHNDNHNWSQIKLAARFRTLSKASTWVSRIASDAFFCYFRSFFCRFGSVVSLNKPKGSCRRNRDTVNLCRPTTTPQLQLDDNVIWGALFHHCFLSSHHSNYTEYVIWFFVRAQRQWPVKKHCTSQLLVYVDGDCQVRWDQLRLENHARKTEANKVVEALSRLSVQTGLEHLDAAHASVIPSPFSTNAIGWQRRPGDHSRIERQLPLQRFKLLRQPTSSSPSEIKSAFPQRENYCPLNYS